MVGTHGVDFFLINAFVNSADAAIDTSFMKHPPAVSDIDGGLRWSWPEGATAHRGTVAEILTQVSKEALQGDSLETVLRRTVECLVRHLPIAIATISLLNYERSHFVQEISAGIELDAPGDLPRPVALGTSGRCIQTARSQLIADVSLDADYVPRHGRVRSEFLVPMCHRGSLLGVLDLESTFKNFFTPEMCVMFDAVAAQVAGAVYMAQALRELEVANGKLKQLSMRDGLTGIANRRSFDQAFAREWAVHQKSGNSMALLLVDVDCFKALNDTRGHLFGDECLRELARLCAVVARDSRVHVARYGGEEFVLLLPDCGLDAARKLGVELCRRIEVLAVEHPASPVASYVTVSIGVSAVCPQLEFPPQSLIQSADRALYAAKAEGRNRVVARDCGC